MLTLNLNKNEAQALLEILDAAVKGRGLHLAKACAVLQDKIEMAARVAAANEKKMREPVAPATPENGAIEQNGVCN